MKKAFTLCIAFLALATLKAQTPEFYFPFDGESLNSSVNSYSLVLTGTGTNAFNTNTHSGNGTHTLSLDGSYYYSSPFQMDTTLTGFTVSYWVKREPNTNNGVGVAQLKVVQTNGGTDFLGTFLTAITPDGRPYMELYPNSQSSTSLYAFNADSLSYNWEFLTFCYGFGNITLFINGVLKATTPATGFNKDASGVELAVGGIPYILNGTPNYTAPLIGSIDEIQFYETALSATEVMNLYNNGTISGIGSVNSDIELGIYPNPAQSTLYFRGYAQVQSATVFNALGETVLQKTNDVESISIEALSAGVYTLNLITPDGRSVAKKFIKE